MSEQAYRQAVAAKGYGEPIEKTWAPGHLNDTHAHDVALFLFITEGEMNVDVEGENGLVKTTCRPGDTIEVPAGALHIERVGETGVRFLVARK